MSDDSPKYKFGPMRVTTAECIDLLNSYTLDEIQIFIEDNMFCKCLYAEVRPYLVARVREQYTNDALTHRKKFYF